VQLALDLKPSCMNEAKRVIRIALLLPVLSAWSGWLAVSAPAAPVTIANERLRIGIHPEKGCLQEVVDLTTGWNHAGLSNHAGGLWQMEASVAGQPQSLTARDAKSFRAEVRSGAHPALQLEWRDFAQPWASDLFVRARVTLEAGAPVSHWELRVEPPESLRVQSLRFPRLPDIARGDRECLAVPVWMGQQTLEPRALFRGTKAGGRREYEYPGLQSLQCLALCQPGGSGLYWAADDTNALRKVFAVFGDAAGRLGFEVVHFPEATPGARVWALPYRVQVGVFQGDWFSAAELYRGWATNQCWAAESRLARGLVPDWVRHTALWVWNRGRSTNVLGPALALRQHLGLPVNVFWHWWHGCAYDTGFPEYLPPREGSEPFAQAVAAARAKGVQALVYMNQRLWGMTTRSWEKESATRFAVKTPDGAVKAEVYNTFTQAPCAAMCLGTAFWRNTYAGLAERAVLDLGVGGIYMDQACASLACYDAAHGHPLGAGNYWVNGFRLLETDLRRRCADGFRPASDPALGRLAGVTLAGEGCGEPWLPSLDLMLSLQVSRERYAAPDGWEPIPFFHAVYHPYAIAFGNYSSLTIPPYDDLWPATFAPREPLKLLDCKFSTQFCLEQARAFVWGQQPTLANFLPEHLESRREELDFVARLCVLRARALKYLLHGTFLRPPELRAPQATLDLSRLSIYAGQQGGVTSYQQSLPLALGAAWRAPDGPVAVTLVNIGGDSVEIAFAVDPAWGLAQANSLHRLDETGRRRLPLADGTKTLSATLSSRSACLLEFSRE
jgi:hypothetical protein